MNHEFSNVHLSLITRGYKIDGYGIKDYCDLNNFKSVDYFYTEDKGYCLVEFSDLYRQQNDIANIIEQTRNSDLDKKIKRNIIKQQHKKIHRELVEKFKDTCYIQKEFDKYILKVPKELKVCGQEYIIVISPLSPILSDERKTDLIRYMDDIKDKVANSIPDCIFGGVKLVSINTFISYTFDS